MSDTRAAAIRLLARREHSTQELRHKLIHKGHPAEDVESCLAALQAERLLSDARFAEAYARMRSERGYGPQRIRAELGERGVEDSLIEHGLGAVELDWCELAVQVRLKRFGGEYPAEFKERAKQMRFLQYRGFEHSQIRAACDDDEF